jgi:hypothetical protein
MINILKQGFVKQLKLKLDEKSFIQSFDINKTTIISYCIS